MPDSQLQISGPPERFSDRLRDRMGPPAKARGRALARCVADTPYLSYTVKHMPRGDLVGTLEHIVLLALVHLGSNAYGVTVRREIVQRTGRDISIGAIYTTLQRLESKGYVSSAVGEPTAERGGRAKRIFRLEANGRRALRASQVAIAQMTAGIQRARSVR